jgi:hypothetical protein
MGFLVLASIKLASMEVELHILKMKFKMLMVIPNLKLINDLGLVIFIY